MLDAVELRGGTVCCRRGRTGDTGRSGPVGVAGEPVSRSNHVTPDSEDCMDTGREPGA